MNNTFHFVLLCKFWTVSPTDQSREEQDPYCSSLNVKKEITLNFPATKMSLGQQVDQT